MKYHNGCKSLTPAQLIERIMSNTKPVNDCLIWLGSRTANNRPQIAWRRQTHSAQRLLYKLLHTDHYMAHRTDFMRTTCGNVMCMNPQHLMLVPRREVLMAALQRTGGRGDNFPLKVSIAKGRKAKLGVQKARDIWAMRAAGKTMKEIGEHYNVHGSTVSMALKSWRRMGVI